jgi:hypothetical protein
MINQTLHRIDAGAGRNAEKSKRMSDIKIKIGKAFRKLSGKGSGMKKVKKAGGKRAGARGLVARSKSS